MSTKANLIPRSGLASDWSLMELSIFDQAKRSLKSQGVDIEIDWGLTDEGDPWLIFCYGEAAELLCHFARIDNEYIACVPFRGRGLTSEILSDLVADVFPLLHIPATPAMQGRSRASGGDALLKRRANKTSGFVE